MAIAIKHTTITDNNTIFFIVKQIKLINIFRIKLKIIYFLLQNTSNYFHIFLNKIKIEQNSPLLPERSLSFLLIVQHTHSYTSPDQYKQINILLSHNSKIK